MVVVVRVGNLSLHSRKMSHIDTFPTSTFDQFWFMPTGSRRRFLAPQIVIPEPTSRLIVAPDFFVGAIRRFAHCFSEAFQNMHRPDFSGVILDLD
jgi:hypothetical protein